MRLRAVLCTTAILAGCRHQPLAYHLTHENSQLILHPPESKPSIKRAERYPSGDKCDVDTGTMRLKWHRRSGVFTMEAQSFDWSSGQARMYVSSAAGIEAFRDALSDLSEKGCLRKESSGDITRSITEQYPMTPATAYGLRFGVYARTGYVDLVPEYQLKVASPAPDGKALVAYYAMERAAPDGKVRMRLFSGVANGLQLPESPGYFRYLFWTSKSAADYHATILGAPDQAALRDATKKFQADPENSWGTSLGRGITCLSVPPNFGVNPEIVVRVNGEETTVPLLGNVRDVMPGGRRAPIAGKTVDVHRMYKGKLIPVRTDAPQDIFDLVLMPGDEVVIGGRS